MAATLEFRNASKRYPGAAEPAVRDLTLEVPAGETCVLVGPSGCGKTTAMRMVNRMIEPTGGDILLDGKSVKEQHPDKLRRSIGYVIQQIGLFPHRTVAQNVATVPELEGWDKRRVAARVDELLDLVGLDRALAKRYPAQLSGGQRQRVGVARALAADPPLLLMDEPFGAVDPIARARVQDEMLRLQSVIRKTILFVTHDIDEAIKMGDRIAVLQVGGVLAQYATPSELLLHPTSDFVAQFVGQDRVLRRLSLQRVGDLPLEPVSGSDGAAPAGTVPASTPVRGAVSLMLEAEDPRLAVTADDGGAPLGVVTLELVHEAVRREAAAGAPDAAVS